jgi:hypothetical protein
MSPRVFVAALLLLGACAPRLGSIALPDPAPRADLAAGDVDAVNPVAATAERPSERRVEVALFVDARRAKPVAEVRDSGDRQVALLESAEPVTIWLRRGIAQELATEGIASVERETEAGAPWRLEGRLREAFATERAGAEAHVSFHAMLRCVRHGEILLSRTYSGTGLLSAETDEAPGAALALALHQAALDLARDVARLPDCAR